MAESQLMCLDDNHINVIINEKNPQFFYCETQRLALEEFLKSGTTDFRKIIKKQGIKDFVSAKEVKKISKNWERYEMDKAMSSQGKAAESDGSLTYWPEQSDIPIPDLDLGWTEHVVYRGITRATAYMHPPKINDPFIREIVRKMIQEARKVVAVVMDDFTDRNIFQDLLEASYWRQVAVYIVLDHGNLQYFLEMCRGIELNKLKIRNIRVRSIGGTDLYLSTGRVKGILNQKFMIVDGDKALSGSYSFTWSCARLHRSTFTLFSGQILEAFDMEFRQLYASSDAVSLDSLLGLRPDEEQPGKDLNTGLISTPQSIELDRKVNNPKYLLVLEGMRRAALDNQLPADDKAPQRILRRRESRGTMRGSRREDESKSHQVVREWLHKYNVSGIDQPEPLEDLVPPSRMPNGGKVASSKFKLPEWGWAGSKRDRVDGESVEVARRGAGAEDAVTTVPRKSMKSKRKRDDPAKGNRQTVEGEAQDKGNAGKFQDRQASTSITSKSKKEKCRVS
ncbi:protein FAM83F-like [Narcine bancroftii]|uniref:protein FAM83F-like n=1 Tax=Narcine bancroftii TaxID=1343680 RepID=UPI0038319BAE